VTPHEHNPALAVRPFAHVVPPAPLVLGFGNTLLGDDGAGVRVVEWLRLRCPIGDCECIDGGTMSFNLLPYVEAAHAMLVVDAADLRAAPGTVVLLEGTDMDDFLKGARRRTVHEIGLMDLLDMARLEACLPQRRALLCVQPGPIEWDDALSPPVAAALPAAARLAIGQLKRWRLA
jgi:hydrogenase maturation protease